MISQDANHAWHASPVENVLSLLDSSPKGLPTEEAARRRAEFGPNALPQQKPPSRWQIFVRQFMSPLIYVLGLAAVVSVMVGEAKDAGFIVFVLLLNATIGAIQEWKAERSAQALQQLLKIHASIERDGEVVEMDAEQAVPGDLVWLESGNRVPADMRLLSAHGLEVDESLLTGESLAVHKDSQWRGEEQTPLADRLNMVHAGSIVSHGRAKGIVVATGGKTVVGQLARDVMGDVGGKPPLLERMEHFTKVIAVASLVGCAGIGLLAGVSGRYDITEVFLFSVALAVAAIPEGLPVAMTIALAVATTRMARRGVIVRRLTAVEGLGSCTLVATDKTGTLTCNELTSREIRLTHGGVFRVSGEGYLPKGGVTRGDETVSSNDIPELNRLCRVATLCNEADLHQRDGTWTWRGDAVDIALLAMAYKLGCTQEGMLDEFPPLNQIPFEPEHRFAASFHRVGADRTLVAVKGAPERIWPMCEFSGNESVLENMRQQAEEMAEAGQRVLALAEGELPNLLEATQTPPEPSGLSLIGLVGMIDPLRPGVQDAIRSCREAGVGVVMVTGDHRKTALAIAREAGIHSDEALTGSEVAERSPEELAEALSRVHVFARVNPRDKLQLVEAARGAGHFVAVTGDGVNDAPALRRANIGVAMGKSGTDVAREAAELVISDDNFATIVAGIEEGRVAYDNIRKVICLLISTGAAELVLVGLAVTTGMPLPLTPVQLLWLNLATQGVQDVALAFEPSEGDILRRKPRPPREPIFNRLMIERTVVAAVAMGTVGFGAFYGMMHSGWEVADARNVLLLLMVLFINIHIGNCRSETKSALSISPLRSPFLMLGALSALGLHVAAMYLPLGNNVLGTSPASGRQWLFCLGLAFTIFPVMELHKWWWARRVASKKEG